MKKYKTHKRSETHYVYGGISYPACQAKARLLDLVKADWIIAKMHEEVTCKNCKKVKSNTHV